MKKAIITGITGQDGSYLAELLLEKGYEVHGILRRSSSFNTSRIDHIHNYFNETNFVNHYGDLEDASSIGKIVREIQPDEFYNLGAQSHVRISFDVPEYTVDTDAVGVLRCLEAIRTHSPHTRFYQASSSEMFGKVTETPQKETTPFYPRSPYGCAKVFGYWITKNYREAYGTHASNGILFNHESPRRGENFVTRKITLSLARIKYGLQDKLRLGNLDAKRDWGYAKEYVEAMWMMLQQKESDDYVIATGETHTVKEFLDEAAKYAGIDVAGHVEIDPVHFRPTEVDLLLGDASKAKKKIGWTPKTTFKELVKIMVDADMKLVEKEIYGLNGKK
ncbi:GDP-mannose 4,6-dehydratase [uncultured archaeon]|nr:GDP-mannose 4,6-dehydratase [uncultured archaeon]